MNISRDDDKYRRWVSSLGCILCEAPAEAAHVRYGEWLNHSKPSTGLQQKPHDKWVIPLCPEHHRLNKKSQHGRNEWVWWAEHGVDPIQMCSHIASSYPDVEAATLFFPVSTHHH